MLSAVHSSGRVLLFGMFPGGATSKALDARSSAAALLFFAFGGTLMSAANRRTVHDLVLAHPQTAVLAAVVQQRIDADPFALDWPDPQVTEALLQTFRAIATASAATGTAAAGLARRLATGEIQPLLRIEPGEASGLGVNQGGDSPAYILSNTKRRAGIAHLYKVGYKMPEQARIDLLRAEAIGQPVRVPATQSLSVINTLAILTGGNVPGAPVNMPAVSLSMHDGAEQTFYELVYLTPVYDRAQPDFFTAERIRLARNDWYGELEGLFERAEYQIVFGAMLEALGLGSASLLASEVALAQAIANIRALAATEPDFFALAEQARNGTALLPGIQGWFTTMAGAPGRIALLSPLILSAVAPLVEAASAVLASQLRNLSLSRVRLLAFQAALRTLGAAFVVAGVFDTAAQYKDLHEGEKGSLFTLTLVAPKVLVSPSSGKVGKGSEQVLTARVTGTQGATLTYRWTLTGSNLANLSDKLGKIGATIDTDSATVTLATTPSTVGTLTITVEAFQVQAGGNRSLGTATSPLVVDDTLVNLTPAEARIEIIGGSQTFTLSITPPPGDGLIYEWTCPSQWGALTSGAASTSSAQPTITSTQATATYAGRAGLDGGESEVISCTAFTGGPPRVDVGTATANVSIKQKFTVELPSVPPEVPSDNIIGIGARIVEPLPTGATVTWTWSHSGVGSIVNVPGDANRPVSSVNFNAGASEGLAIFTVSVTVSVPGQGTVRVLPVTRGTQVKKGLKTITVEGFYQLEQGAIPLDPPQCGFDGQGKQVCLLGYLDTWVYYIVPKVANAQSYAITLYNPQGGSVFTYNVPKNFAIGGPNIKDGGGTLRIPYWASTGPYSSYDGVSNYETTQATQSAYLVNRARTEIPRVVAVVTLAP